jgi:hypothetical protein
LASLGKLDYPVCYFGASSFGSFRVKPRKELDLKIQCVFRNEKELKSIKDQRWKKSKPRAEAIKTRLSGFLRTNRVLLGFEI